MSPELVRFSDANDGSMHEGYRVMLKELTPDDWAWIIADLRSRRDDLPPSDAAVRALIESQSAFIIRRERVELPREEKTDQ